MLHLQQQEVDSTNLPSSRRAYRKNSESSISRTEFNFWDENTMKKLDERHVGSESSQLEFQTETNVCNAYSPRFCASMRQEESTLLPRVHYYSYKSSESRLQVMAESRRELMKMVEDMPESNYELSLKDIVVDDPMSKQEVAEDAVERKLKRNKKKSFKRSMVSRSASMDSEVFLLKMFLPACLCSKNHNKVSLAPSFGGSEKYKKEWWGVRFLVTRENANSSSISSSGRSMSSRNADSSYKPTCWSSDNLYKSRRQRGCLF